MNLGDDRELNTTHRAVLTGSVVVGAFTDALRVHPSIPEEETAKEKDKEKNNDKQKMKKNNNNERKNNKGENKEDKER